MTTKPKKKKPIVEFEVNIDMTWSQTYRVKARTAGEANRKAWAKFKARPPKKNFDFLTDKA